MHHTTPNLDLPLIQPGQAQKHVTHNEALQIVDSLVQPVVIDRGLDSPPLTAQDGDRYLVGNSPSGSWSDHANAFAVFASGGWMFLEPQVGWKAYVQSESRTVTFDGSTWATDSLGSVDSLGVSTTADATNRLAVASPATLLTHDGAGHQLKINKSDEAETNSLLFQTNWSGRAEMGCAGSDDFSIKVSDDGATFNEAMVVDAATGAVRFPNGVAGTGSAAGPMGGQTVAFVSERNSTVSVGTILSFGNGAVGAGPVVPFDARVVALTLSVSGGPAGTTTLDLRLNGVADPTNQIQVTYSGSDVDTAVVDLSATPVAVPAGTALSLICSQTVGAGRLVGTIFVAFD